MEPDTDESREELIKFFRRRLKELIVVERVLALIHFIENDIKEQIRLKARNDGDMMAAECLIDAVIKRPHTPGWFTAFVDALLNGGCKYAADLMLLNLPSPEDEAENDTCIRLIQLLGPSLVDMQTDQVSELCFSKDLLTQDEFEKVSAHYGASSL